MLYKELTGVAGVWTEEGRVIWTCDYFEANDAVAEASDFRTRRHALCLLFKNRGLLQPVVEIIPPEFEDLDIPYNFVASTSYLIYEELNAYKKKFRVRKQDSKREEFARDSINSVLDFGVRSIKSIFGPAMVPRNRR